MTIKTIFFVGRPGSGKGTQAKLLADKTGWPVISAGKLFRSLSAEQTPVGRKIKEENDAGMLQPHWLATYLYLKALFELPADADAIFEGFNRKMAEAELIVESLAWIGRSPIIINIEISDEEARERIEKRKTIEGRADDNVIEERLKEYYDHTQPAIEIFRDTGVLITINGETSPEEAARAIRKALKIDPE
ncbi:nucleoside monophosphate kinase [Patescibacteria group bacterium]|nr:nucleoside monophosphate kinase [Patescibacteria group bacterium]